MSNDAQELRVALYSHDSLGLGHTRRNLAVAQALAEALPAMTGRKISGLLITGERTATSYRCPTGFDWLVVPGISKGRDSYQPRSMAVDTDRLLDIRSGIIAGALESLRPHLVIVDRHAFGVNQELAGPLRYLKAAKPETAIVLGLREVLDDPAETSREWKKLDSAAIDELFDAIWVYGDSNAHNLVTTGELPERFAHKVSFTGLLAAGRKTSGRTPAITSPFALTMVGGGSDGYHLAKAAAAAEVPTGWSHLVVTGPHMPAVDRARVEAEAREGTRVMTKVSDGLSYISRAQAVITMGGYNSIAEVLSTMTPALAVPRVTPRTEQLIRVAGLAKFGALDYIDPAELTPQALTQWLQGVAAHPHVASAHGTARQRLNLNGLAHLPKLAKNLVDRSDRNIRKHSPAPRVSLRQLHAATTTAGQPMLVREGSHVA